MVKVDSILGLIEVIESKVNDCSADEFVILNRDNGDSCELDVKFNGFISSVVAESVFGYCLKNDIMFWFCKNNIYFLAYNYNK